MSKISTFKILWKTNKRGVLVACFNYIVKSGILNNLNDKKFLNLSYWIHNGRFINWENPMSFNEKLQWLKVFDRNPRYCILVDKAEAKNYVANTIGNEYIIPTVGVWNNVDDISFDKLPNQFVIKCTHDSGSICICKDKDSFDVNKAKRILKKGMKRNLFYWGREWPYKNLKPRIIAEKYIEANDGELRDYKLMCFNGNVKCSFVCSDRFNGEGLKVTFFDSEWKKMPFQRHYPVADYDIPIPSSYNKMVELAEKLSANIPFVRVDFYDVNGHPYFGEMTFFPGNGSEEFDPEEWDLILGSWIKLPKDRH